MLRRKLFLYTVSFITGIVASYFFLEKTLVIPCFLMLFSSEMIILKIDLENNESTENKERIILTVFLILGFLLFLFRYIYFNAPIKDTNKNIVEIEEISNISGKITSIQEKKDSIKFFVVTDDILSGKKVEISYFSEINGIKDIYDMYGAKVSLYGKLKLPTCQENPECFNYRIYQYSKGISYNFSAKSINILEYSNSLFWEYKKIIAKVRDKFVKSFSNSEIRAFIKGVIFGDKSEFDEETIEEFNTNSTGHILAVSGLHVGFLFALLRFLTKKSRGKFASALIIAVLLLYGEMTGWSPSTVRATIVLGLNIVSIYFKKTPDLLTSVSTAALMILFFNPYMLFNSGFQLSFLALLGLSFLVEPLSYFVGEYFAALLSVQFVIAPMIAYSYNGFNITSLIVNIPIVFLASLLVPMCIIALMVMILIGFIPDFYKSVIELLSNVILIINEKLSFNGDFYVNAKGINTGILVFIYLLLFLFASEWVRIKLIRKDRKSILRAISVILIPALCIGFACKNKFSNDEIVFVSVGQGDCTHVRGKMGNVLIDGGGNKEYNIGKNTLKPYLLKNRFGKVDAAMVTHLHTDHYLGISELNECFQIDNILIPDNYEDIENSGDTKNIKKCNNLSTIACGNRIDVDDNIFIEPIWPAGQYSEKISSENENENNMVYMINCKGLKIMITGDLVSEDEEKMLEYYKNTNTLKCDVLKVGHHGSKTSSSDEFLDAVNPEIAVISVGANNMYGHPNQETLEKLEKRGIKTYRTDLNGAVGIDISKNGIMVDVME